MPSPFARAIVIVLDGVGIGELPDAGTYGDSGSNTVRNIARQVPLHVPTLRALGLGQLAEIGGACPPDVPLAAIGRMAEASAGKDSVTGHWEMMGIVLEQPFPVFPDGFPASVITDLSRQSGREVLGNYAASGTRIIDDLGPQHMRTGALIVYTSADSVFQIAAHEDIVPVAELYRVCEIAYRLVVDGLGVGRVIARPFVGTPGNFRRTSNRRDYTLKPVRETLLDRLKAASVPVVAVGKIDDLFGGRGITHAIHTATDDEGMDCLLQQMTEVETGLIFTNLVDFDTVYGHRNDVEGYAQNLERFDRRLAELLPTLDVGDLLIVTADHGNDPTTPSTDHSREFVPLFVSGDRVQRGTNLGTRHTFADVGQTLAEMFSVGRMPHGTSFLDDILSPRTLPSFSA